MGTMIEPRRVTGGRTHLPIVLLLIALLAIPCIADSYPPRLRIFHFDVNVGDATLIITPDGHGVLIDAGNRGRGKNPIKYFLDQAKEDGVLTSLDYFIASHHDSDHIGGADELFNDGWYPAVNVLDRGDSFLPPFNRSYVEEKCAVDVDEAESIVGWGTAQNCPASSRRASCQIVEYFLAVEAGGKRKTIRPGDVLTLDHGIEIIAVVVNDKDLDGDSVDVFFTGRRDDCAANDLGVGLLVKFGDFRYLLAGDLTGDPSEDVADVENLIKDEAKNVDVYHVNHHGALTSSSDDFMAEISPTVAIVSNGTMHGHPRKKVIEDRIESVTPSPKVYLTNLNDDSEAWSDDKGVISDLDPTGYDGMIELQVWRRSYRVFLWRNSQPITPGERFFIEDRD